MNLSFSPLSQENLAEATSLLIVIFPDDPIAPVAYKASLDPTDKRWENRKILDYYVVSVEGTDKIIALTGFYQWTSHAEDEIWLGWYGVAPAERGKGIGRKVLEWTINKARERGYRKLRLWTTESPEEAPAQKLYDSVGLKVYEEKIVPEEDYKVLYREIIL